MGRSPVSVRCQHLWESATFLGAESSVKFGRDTLHCRGPIPLEKAARGVLICKHADVPLALPVHDFEGAHVETRLLGALHDVVAVDLGLARELFRSGLPEPNPLEASIDAKKCHAKEAESLRANGTPAFFGSQGFDRPAAGS